MSRGIVLAVAVEGDDEIPRGASDAGVDGRALAAALAVANEAQARDLALQAHDGARRRSLLPSSTTRTSLSGKASAAAAISRAAGRCSPLR